MKKRIKFHLSVRIDFTRRTDFLFIYLSVVLISVNVDRYDTCAYWPSFIIRPDILDQLALNEKMRKKQRNETK